MGTGRYDIGTPEHERWLAAEADRLLEFYRAAADKSGGGFWWLDRQGNPQPEQGKQLWLNARMVHGFALGALSGRDDLRALVTHGVEFLAEGPLHDADHGGWMWSTDADGAVVDTSKQAYGHAFVLLASCSAQLAGVDASSLRDEVVSIIDQRYWREADGLCVDTYDRTWSDLERYRGQNANMHLVEAFLAAADVTGEPVFHQRATRIAKRLIDEFTRANDWRLAEHYDESWRIERDYNIDDKDHPFRPYGSIVGHWFEWARLLVQLHAARPASAAPDRWVLEAARALFARGIADGWDHEHTGIHYVVDFSGTPLNKHRYHWVIAEAIGAAAALYLATEETEYQRWYQRFWNHAERFHLDRRHGSWHHELTAENVPTADVWDGKPDLYHALQATYFARVELNKSIAAELATQ